MPNNFYKLELSLEEIKIIKICLNHSIESAKFDLYFESRAEQIIKLINNINYDIYRRLH